MNQLGRGNTAEVFAYGEDKICKLFYEGFPEQAIEMEYKNAVEMNRLGILVPKCYEMIQIDHRRGIIYERIDGKEMLSMLFDDGDLEACLVKFVSLQKELLLYH